MICVVIRIPGVGSEDGQLTFGLEVFCRLLDSFSRCRQRNGGSVPASSLDSLFRTFWVRFMTQSKKCSPGIEKDYQMCILLSPLLVLMIICNPDPERPRAHL